MAIDPHYRPPFYCPSTAVVFSLLLSIATLAPGASGQTPPPTETPNSTSRDATSAPQNFVSANPPVAPAANAETASSLLVDPNELVLNAVQNSVWGPAFSCRVQQKTFYGKHTTIAQGQYLQAGNGSCQMKFMLKLGVGAEVQTIFQVSDGRMLWTSLGEDQPYRTVNVSSIRTDVASYGRRLQESPEATLYLAIGGQAEVLRSLYMHYRWHKAYAVSLDNVPVWQLIGTLRTEPPRVRADAQCDQILKTEKKNVVPHDVRLTLSRNSPRTLFPYRIEYFLRQPGKNGQADHRVPFSTLEYFELEEKVTIPEDAFRTTLQENIHGREDETKRYLKIATP